MKGDFFLRRSERDKGAALRNKNTNIQEIRGTISWDGMICTRPLNLYNLMANHTIDSISVGQLVFLTK